MQKHNNTAMTLRLTFDLSAAVEEISETLQMSKTSFIRRAIRRSIEHSTRHELPLLEERGIREALAR